jgi:branched-chain amino acid transport system substrate-binding protein
MAERDSDRRVGRRRRPMLAGALAALLSASVGAAWAAEAEPSREPLIIGVAAPLTGDSSAEGPELRSGVTLAVASLDPAHLVGRRVQVVTVDDACEPPEAMAAARELVARHAVLVVGHVCSSATLAAAPIYAAAGILQITPASTSPAITEQGIATLFRTIGRDDRQGEAAAAMIASHFPSARLAILDDGNAYGGGLADALGGALTARHFPIALRRRYDRHGADFQDTAEAVKAAHADLVYLSGDELNVGILASTCRAAGITAQFIGGDSMVNPRFHMAAAGAAEGTIFSFPPDLARQPEAAPALARFAAAGIEPDGYALLAYAAVQAWAQAATASGTTDAAPVARLLRERSFDTAIGAVRFDAKGDIIGRPADFVWYHWQHGSAQAMPEN